MTNQQKASLIKSASIKKVAVIGAGVMGAGIAAQAANGGADVLLLDILPKDAGNDQTSRNSIAQGALDRFLKAGSAGGLMHPTIAERITVGNTEDHFAQLAEYDWIIEVVIERLDIKQSLYKRIEAVRAPHAIVSSNTSTIPLEKLTEGLPESFCQHFVVTHYFNPPRYMRLVEVVAGEHTLPEVVKQISHFNDHQMGKTVIHCADRPGFIANRLGVFWMQVALQEAINLDLTVEEADTVMQVCGFPKTGIFGLWDLCGIDLMPSVTASLASLLPSDDDFAPYAQTVPVVQTMVDKGWFGRKGRVLQGFYRQTKDEAGRKTREVLDLTSVTYRAPQKPELDSCQVKPGDLKTLLAGDDKGAVYAWRVLSQMLRYATQLVPDVAEDTNAVDSAMKLGYNWRFGPFELIQRIGMPDFCQRLQASNLTLTPFLLAPEDYDVSTSQPEGILRLEEVKQNPAIKQFSRCCLWSLDSDSAIENKSQDKVWCLELTDKVNPLSSTLLSELEQALQLVIENNAALVIYSEGPVFVAGADLKEFLTLTEQDGAIDAFIRRGQVLFHAIESAPVPVVAAVAGKALGGGLELILHCHAVQAYAESNLGLVENLVGIIPGWGGCKQLLARTAEAFGPDQAIKQTFDLIQGAKVTASALEAQQLGILKVTDGITMNRDRLLFDAKQKAQILWAESRQSERQRPSSSKQILTPQNLNLTDAGYQAELEKALLDLLNQASNPDWYDRFYDLERECNLSLIDIPEAKSRIEHFLAKGKPLRN